MTLTRPLTPLERAILQAIVELGEDAYGADIKKKVVKTMRQDFAIGVLYVTLNELEDDGFVKAYRAEQRKTGRGWGGRAKRYWRTVFDLTEVLKP